MKRTSSWLGRGARLRGLGPACGRVPAGRLLLDGRRFRLRVASFLPLHTLAFRVSAGSFLHSVRPTKQCEKPFTWHASHLPGSTWRRPARIHGSLSTQCISGRPQSATPRSSTAVDGGPAAQRDTPLVGCPIISLLPSQYSTAAGIFCQPAAATQGRAPPLWGSARSYP